MVYLAHQTQFQHQIPACDLDSPGEIALHCLCFTPDEAQRVKCVVAILLFN